RALSRPGPKSHRAWFAVTSLYLWDRARLALGPCGRTICVAAVRHPRRNAARSCRLPARLHRDVYPAGKLSVSRVPWHRRRWPALCGLTLVTYLRSLGPRGAPRGFGNLALALLGSGSREGSALERLG